MDIMVDIETLGGEPTAVILSIGAVAFDEHGLHHEFYKNISIADSLKSGRTVSGDTIEWWFSQDDKAIKSLCGSKETLKNVMDGFYHWYNDCRPHAIWANGVNFDITILENAFTGIGMGVPWYYGRVYCMRPIREIGKKIGVPYRDFRKEFNDNQHDALSDAKCQAQYVKKIFDLILQTHK